MLHLNKVKRSAVAFDVELGARQLIKKEHRKYIQIELSGSILT